ncbi:Autophagy-related protein 16 [Armadillidium vulgare]|nr:Autophagy-related protein 16 [Armadillidium vulgare]
MYGGNSWRQQIYTSLRTRNKVECENIRDLISSYNRLFDYETKQLNVQNEKLKDELILSHNNRSSPGVPSSSTLLNGSTCSVNIQHYEQKIYKLQEEVTELHRRRSENSQQLVELNQCLQERDRVLVSLRNKLAEKETELLLLKENVSALEAKIQETEEHNQLLRDEYQALNLTCNSYEEKNKKLIEENQELIQRWMALKEKDAERMNEENEAAVKKRQEIVEKNLKEACLESKLDAHEEEVNALVFSDQGRLLASGGSDRRIKLWDINHGTADQKAILSGSNLAVTAIDFDSDESIILGASNDFACRVWTLCDLRLRHTLTGHSGKVMACKFLAEPSRVVTGSHDRTLKIWDLRSMKTLFPGSSCNDIVVSDSQCSSVISGHFDKTVKFWDLRTEDKTFTLPLQGRVTSLSLSWNGFHIGSDQSRAVFSPDGAYAASGCGSGSLIIWNVDTGQVEKQLSEHTTCVLAVAWHPKGKIITTCDRSKKIIVWGDF